MRSHEDPTQPKINRQKERREGRKEGRKKEGRKEGKKERKKERKKGERKKRKYLFFFLVAPCDMQDLSSLTRDQTCASCIGSTEY